ncbi:ATP-binding protein [Streptomyces sp. NPDC059761]|uniref:ATP-binding protein n=1 Tax=unclassified Streptomyces TaxID=2593676 RepID=UPI00364F6DB6
MSLPLTRRIARTALLLAAGAAPVVGAAGAASAADLGSVPQLGPLTSPVASDATGPAGDVVGTGEAAATTATDTAAKAVPGAPAEITDTATGLLGGLPAKGLPAKGLPTGNLPTGDLPTGALPTDAVPGGLTGALPTQGVPLGGLPLGG